MRPCHRHRARDEARKACDVDMARFHYNHTHLELEVTEDQHGLLIDQRCRGSKQGTSRIDHWRRRRSILEKAGVWLLFFWPGHRYNWFYRFLENFGWIQAKFCKSKFDFFYKKKLKRKRLLKSVVLRVWNQDLPLSKASSLTPRVPVRMCLDMITNFFLYFTEIMWIRFFTGMKFNRRWHADRTKFHSPAPVRCFFAVRLIFCFMCVLVCICLSSRAQLWPVVLCLPIEFAVDLWFGFWLTSCQLYVPHQHFYEELGLPRTH